MTQSLHPKDGIRLLLERGEASDAEARYQAAVFTPSERFDYRAVLRNDGSAELTPATEPAAPEHEKALDNLARSTARAAARKLAESLPPWPARILRWRGPGRG